jgi:hypothetical protein
MAPTKARPVASRRKGLRPKRSDRRPAERVDFEGASGRYAVGGLQPAHEIDETDIEPDGVEYRQAGKAEHDAPVILQRFHDRRALARLARDGVEHVPAQKVAGDTDQQPEQERDAPPPGLERRTRHRRRKARAHGGAEQDAAARAARCQCTHQPAAAFRRALDQEHHGTGIFAAD